MSTEDIGVVRHRLTADRMRVVEWTREPDADDREWLTGLGGRQAARMVNGRPAPVPRTWVLPDVAAVRAVVDELTQERPAMAAGGAP